MSTTEAAKPEEAVAPDTKKQKMSVEQAPDAEWPEAWILPDDVKDQCSLNKLEPNQAYDAEAMRKLGIAYWKMDADAFSYPEKEVPWDPSKLELITCDDCFRIISLPRNPFSRGCTGPQVEGSS